MKVNVTRSTPPPQPPPAIQSVDLVGLTLAQAILIKQLMGLMDWWDNATGCDAREIYSALKKAGVDADVVDNGVQLKKVIDGGATTTYKLVPR